MSEQFVISIRGGEYTFKKTGMAADCVVCSARGAVAKDFCRQWGLQVMYSFSFNKYSEEGAMKLVKEMTSRLQWWYEVYTDRLRGSDTEPSDADFEGYPGDVDFQQWLSTLHPGSALAKRGASLICLKPKRSVSQASGSTG